MAKKKQTFSGSVTGRVRVIIDGDNINSTNQGPGHIYAEFDQKVEISDLDAPENTGGGSAQPIPDPTAPV